MGCKACAAASAAYQKKKAADFRKNRNVVAPAPVAKALPPKPVVPIAKPKSVVPVPAGPIIVPAKTVAAPIVVARTTAKPKSAPQKMIRVKPSPQAVELAKQASKRRKLLEDYKRNKIAHKK